MTQEHFQSAIGSLPGSEVDPLSSDLAAQAVFGLGETLQVTPELCRCPSNHRWLWKPTRSSVVQMVAQLLGKTDGAA